MGVNWGRIGAGIATGGLSEVARYGAGQVRKPYEQAAEGAFRGQQQANAFGDDQWKRQMEGLGAGQNAWGGAQSYWNNTYGNRGPSTMEGAFSSYGNKYLNTPNSQNVFEQYGKEFMNGPSWTQQGLNEGKSFVNMPGRSEGVMDNAFQNPSQSKMTFGTYFNGMQNPGAMESWWQNNQGAFNTPGASQSVYDGFSSQLYGPGRAESYQPTMASAAGSYQAGQEQRLGNETRNLERASGEVGGMFRGANGVQSFAQRQQPGLERQGLYEQAITANLTGNDPMMDRQMSKGLASINQEMARRGHFKSGGADTAIGEFVGKMGAEDYDRRLERAQAAQGMELSRLGQAQGLASAASGERMGQGSALQGLASQRDTIGFGREDARAKAAGMLSQEQLANSRLGLDSAIAADQSKNNRLTTLQGMAGAADSSEQANRRIAMEGAGRAQDSALDRMKFGMSASGQLDDNDYRRTMGRYEMANGIDNRNLQRGQMSFDMGRGMDQFGLDKWKTYGQLGQGADDAGLGFLNGYFNNANLTSQDQRLWAGDGMQGAQGISGGLANLIQAIYGNAGNLRGDAFNTGMGAYSNGVGLQAQGGAAPWEVLLKGLGYGAQAYGKGG